MDKIVLITGAAGYIGKLLVNYFLDHNYIVYGIDYNESALIKLESNLKKSSFKAVPMDYSYKYIKDIYFYNEVSITIHAAALKNTRYCNEYRDYYYKRNVVDTIQFLKFSNRYTHDKIIFLSSTEAYKPHNEFGKQKYKVEQYIKNADNKCIVQTLRFPFLLGSNGSVYHIFKDQALNNKPLTLTSESITKFSATKNEFLIGWNDFFLNVNKSGNFNLNIGHRILIRDIANQVIDETNSKSRIKIIGLRSGDIMEEEIIKKHEKTKISDYIDEII